MNQFVNILNRIRQKADESWLTLSQQMAKEEIIKKLKFLDEVNLWGSHGAGKTFLGWIMWKQNLVDYSASREYVVSSGSRIIVVDNSSWKRRDVLETLHHYRVRGYDKVLFITTEPVQHSIATVELKLKLEDLKKASSNLHSIGVPPYANNPKSLWDLVIPAELRGG